MRSVFVAMFAELTHFKTIFERLFIFRGKIIEIMTLGTLHFNQIFLGHTIELKI